MNQALLDHTQSLIEKVCNNNDTVKKPHVILGLSGGPDSVYLLYLLKRLHDDGALTFHAAHLNHGWRTSASDDAVFCIKLCVRLGIPVTVRNSYTTETKENGSQEARGRTLRRTFFKELKQRYQADGVLLAHHMQDQQETFFLRMLRGAMLTGLCGMRDITDFYIRPLLKVHKHEIISYLCHNNIPYRIDDTNESYTYLRNRVRLQVIPALRAADSRFDATFQRLIKHLQADEALLHKLTLRTFNNVFNSERQGTRSRFIACDHHLQRRVIMYWLVKEQVPFVPQETFLQEILRFIRHLAGGSHQLNNRWRLVKSKDLFWLEKMAGTLKTVGQ